VLSLWDPFNMTSLLQDHQKASSSQSEVSLYPLTMNFIFLSLVVLSNDFFTFQEPPESVQTIEPSSSGLCDVEEVTMLSATHSLVRTLAALSFTIV